MSTVHVYNKKTSEVLSLFFLLFPILVFFLTLFLLSSFQRREEVATSYDYPTVLGEKDNN